MTHSQTHALHVQQRWYDLIASSQKKDEGRLAEQDINLIQYGDTIEFITEDRRPLLTVVTYVTRYKNFGEMLSGDGLRRLLPGVESLDDGLEIYRGFPGYREGEVEYGAIVFALALL